MHAVVANMGCRSTQSFSGSDEYFHDSNSIVDDKPEASSMDHEVDKEVGYGRKENPVRDEAVHALLAYTEAFPNGHEIIRTPSNGLLCGFHAVVRSMQTMHPYLPCPAVASLLEVLNCPAFVEHANAFGMTNDNNCKSSYMIIIFSLIYWGFLCKGANYDVF